ncbi:hypothetical protein [Staphylococcus aureus]|uniref:hypothetical protein n=1 Tax=Staphylococcus aureus TaxID=1280 RepID=UPI000448CB28|nr:hypothetical protein [Staphylococcus aureus]EGQ0541957.1 hypothetical protein [Staphylococcus aureus]EZY69327.1 hypothetical protein V063_02484 [Staphylococcus aureus R0487]EZY76242.1 hypothetical protein V066_02672 [Staphylococcus aureus R0615]MCR0868877.1 hypothetical protein [Staphylococcus aureus]MCS5351907.1 hypothetical protein [Staphylococcus aureus]
MAKKSLISDAKNNLDNKFINKSQKIRNLPQTSIRVKGVTHSKIVVLKRLEMVESIDEILDEALELYINRFSEEKQKEIKTLVNEENDYKIKKVRKQNNKNK